jgi:hypothetical protein
MKKIAFVLPIVLILAICFFLLPPGYTKISEWQGWQQGLLFFAGLAGLHFFLHWINGPGGTNPPDYPP